MAVAHYLEALAWQREVSELHAIFGGRNPHPNMCVGGMPCAISLESGKQAGTALDVVRDYESAAVRLDMDGEVEQVDASLIVAPRPRRPDPRCDEEKSLTVSLPKSSRLAGRRDHAGHFRPAREICPPQHQILRLRVDAELVEGLFVEACEKGDGHDPRGVGGGAGSRSSDRRLKHRAPAARVDREHRRAAGGARTRAPISAGGCCCAHAARLSPWAAGSRSAETQPSRPATTSPSSPSAPRTTAWAATHGPRRTTRGRCSCRPSPRPSASIAR